MYTRTRTRVCTHMYTHTRTHARVRTCSSTPSPAEKYVNSLVAPPGKDAELLRLSGVWRAAAQQILLDLFQVAGDRRTGAFNKPLTMPLLLLQAGVHPEQVRYDAESEDFNDPVDVLDAEERLEVEQAAKTKQ